jgi:hypothetical protein
MWLPETLLDHACGRQRSRSLRPLSTQLSPLSTQLSTACARSGAWERPAELWSEGSATCSRDASGILWHDYPYPSHEYLYPYPDCRYLQHDCRYLQHDCRYLQHDYTCTLDSIPAPSTTAAPMSYSPREIGSTTVALRATAAAAQPFRAAFPHARRCILHLLPCPRCTARRHTAGHPRVTPLRGPAML